MHDSYNYPALHIKLCIIKKKRTRDKLQGLMRNMWRGIYGNTKLCELRRKCY
jgi:hypothetical protein